MAEDSVVHPRGRAAPRPPIRCRSSLLAGRTPTSCPPPSGPMLRSRHGARTAPRRAPAAPSTIRRSHPSPRSITPAQPPQLAHVWAQVRAELRRLVDDQALELWLDPLEPVELEGSKLVLASDPALRDWIETRFGRH